MRGSSIEGLWVILVPEGERKVPMLARAGAGLYLLGFSDGQKARKFIADSRLDDGEPRLLVKGNVPEMIGTFQGKGVQGVLVDYDAETNTYKDAGLVY